MIYGLQRLVVVVRNAICIFLGCGVAILSHVLGFSVAFESKSVFFCRIFLLNRALRVVIFDDRHSFLLPFTGMVDWLEVGCQLVAAAAIEG